MNSQSSASTLARTGMQSSQSTSKENSQYLSFTLDSEEYGVEILRVREIRAWQQLRSLPDMPAHIIGVMDLRGTIVPVVDLRKRFKQEKIEYLPTTVIIVLSVEIGSRQTLFGIVVDGVSEVLDVVSAQIRSAPDLGTEIDTRYIAGIVAHNGQMVMLLDIDSMFNPVELAAF